MIDLSPAARPVPIALAGLLRLGETARRVPGASRYFVTDHGRVFSVVGKPRPLRPYARKSNGYLQVDIWFDGEDGATKRRVVYVHVLVALAFIGPRPASPGVTFDVDHVDEDPLNNWAGNLRYITKSRNVQRAMRSGAHPSAKLSPVVVWTLRCRAHAEDEASVVAEATERFGISAQSVRTALAGRSWAWVPQPAGRPTAEQLSRSLCLGSYREADRLLALSPFEAPGRTLPIRESQRRAA